MNTTGLVMPAMIQTPRRIVNDPDIGKVLLLIDDRVGYVRHAAVKSARLEVYDVYDLVVGRKPHIFDRILSGRLISITKH